MSSHTPLVRTESDAGMKTHRSISRMSHFAHPVSTWTDCPLCWLDPETRRHGTGSLAAHQSNAPPRTAIKDMCVTPVQTVQGRVWIQTVVRRLVNGTESVTNAHFRLATSELHPRQAVDVDVMDDWRVTVTVWPVGGVGGAFRSSLPYLSDRRLRQWFSDDRLMGVAGLQGFLRTLDELVVFCPGVATYGELQPLYDTTARPEDVLKRHGVNLTGHTDPKRCVAFASTCASVVQLHPASAHPRAHAHERCANCSGLRTLIVTKRKATLSAAKRGAPYAYARKRSLAEVIVNSDESNVADTDTRVTATVNDLLSEIDIVRDLVAALHDRHCIQSGRCGESAALPLADGTMLMRTSQGAAQRRLRELAALLDEGVPLELDLALAGTICFIHNALSRALTRSVSAPVDPTVLHISLLLFDRFGPRGFAAVRRLLSPLALPARSTLQHLRPPLSSGLHVAEVAAAFAAYFNDHKKEYIEQFGDWKGVWALMHTVNICYDTSAMRETPTLIRSKFSQAVQGEARTTTPSQIVRTTLSADGSYAASTALVFSINSVYFSSLRGVAAVYPVCKSDLDQAMLSALIAEVRLECEMYGFHIRSHTHDADTSQMAMVKKAGAEQDMRSAYRRQQPQAQSQDQSKH